MAFRVRRSNSVMPKMWTCWPLVMRPQGTPLAFGFGPQGDVALIVHRREVPDAHLPRHLLLLVFQQLQTEAILVAPNLAPISGIFHAPDDPPSPSTNLLWRRLMSKVEEMPDEL